MTLLSFTNPSFMQWIEIISVALNLAFIILLTKQIKWCWVAGFFGSLTAAFVFYKTFYYSESLLYLFYAVIAIVAFVRWNVPKSDLKIQRISTKKLVFWLILGSVFTGILGYVMQNYTAAQRPYLDAVSSVFGVIATFLEIKMYIEGWLFWIGLNAYSIWLYGLQNLDFLVLQMVVFTLLSLRGYWVWRKELLLQQQI